MSAESGMASDEKRMRWEPRRQSTLQSARRRTMVIRLLRLSFLVFAIAVVLVLAGYIVVNSLHKEPPPVLPQTPQTDEEVQMISPRFTGRDNAGRPYEVIADTATRNKEAPEITYLVNIRMDSAQGDNSSHVTARTGVYDSARKILDLDEDVRLISPNGFVYTTSKARFFIDSNRIVGDQRVFGNGPTGTVEADGYEIIDGGKKVIFSGNVITHIENAQGQDGVANE